MSTPCKHLGKKPWHSGGSGRFNKNDKNFPQCQAEAAPFAKVCHLSILQQDQGGGPGGKGGSGLVSWAILDSKPCRYLTSDRYLFFSVLFVSMLLTSWMKNHGISWYFGISKTVWVALKMVKMIQRCHQQLLRRRLRWISWRCHMNLWRWTLWRVLKSSFPRSQWRCNRGKVDDSAPFKGRVMECHR